MNLKYAVITINETNISLNRTPMYNLDVTLRYYN